ncbi:hypothetical protein [Wenjunlia tyrosinilytica]|uniref:Uncharacterized protein n=1 Tax=Wenjunlia tyrosinilytica TaxID=1544741 RepID=A0A917ZVQ8_9ACTN|nr:hypothetical protein [Wenjunlia tyrosinilytica]GGO94722.1 hypothetical protein GCM10012280_50290 [Wenjunlia tyrosinilytica]
MTDDNRQYGAQDDFAFRDNTFQGPFQTEGVQNIHYYSVPPAKPQARKWWRRATGRSAALALVLVAGGAYTVYALGSFGGTPKGIPVPRPVNPGNAKLPSYVHIQAQEHCASSVNYYAETADDYRRGEHKGQRRLGPVAVDITSQTSSKEAVLLVGMRVLDLERKDPPATGIAVADGGCGAAVDVRPFWTDLNKSDPPIIAKAAAHPPVTFPYKISSNDPEVFELTLENNTCFCAFAVEIDWVAAGKAGKTVLNNGGSGFLSSAAPKVAAYTLDSSSRLLRTTYGRLLPSRS